MRLLRSAVVAEGELAFLVGKLIDAATLERAETIAQEWGVMPHEALISLGWVSEADYVAMLATALGIDWLGRRRAAEPGSAPGELAFPGHHLMAGELLIEAYRETPAAIRAAVRGLPPHVRPLLATRREVDAIRLAGLEQSVVDLAIDGLWRSDPLASARTGPQWWQAGLVGLSIAGVVLSIAAWGEGALAVLLVLLTLPFACIAALRAAALAEVLRRREPPLCGGEAAARRLADASLPRYTALVPLYREVDVLPDLIDAMSAIDYPAAKLDVILVLEADDTATLAAARTLDLPGNVRAVVVPAKGPRTKPKALNYAFALTDTPFVVVFDAEDRPEPGQLRAALAVFGASGPDLACVQARLAIHNADQGWLARQFALEYAALFDAQLPALARMGLPVPLGGTSNHFRADALRSVGGWDPYNVTEDADLGIRLARRGYRTAIIPSTTWEEAPIRAGSWLRQRTRWIKGWMQTYIVVTRSPIQHVRELGAWQAFGLHVLIGGMLMSALAHPLCLAVLAWQAATGTLLDQASAGTGQVLLALALANFCCGYLGAMAAGAASALRRCWWRTAAAALTMPVYWLMVSLAAYRALLQLAYAPHLWEKTDHGHSQRAGPKAAGSGSRAQHGG